RLVPVPDPGVLESEVVVWMPALVVADLLVDGIGQIEPSLGLDHEVEDLAVEDDAVLLVQLELDLGLVPLEVLGTHASNYRNPIRPGGQASTTARPTRCERFTVPQ